MMIGCFIDEDMLLFPFKSIYLTTTNIFNFFSFKLLFHFKSIYLTTKDGRQRMKCLLLFHFKSIYLTTKHIWISQMDTVVIPFQINISYNQVSLPMCGYMLLFPFKSIYLTTI